VVRLEVEEIVRRNEVLSDLFDRISAIGIPSLVMFSHTEEETNPWNFPEHTRSVSWLIETQVIRVIESNMEILGIQRLNRPAVDDSPWDLMISFNGETFFIDIKTFQTGATRAPSDLISVVRWNEFRQSSESDYWMPSNQTETTLNFCYFEVNIVRNRIFITFEKVMPIEFISKINGPELWDDEFRIDFTSNRTKIAVAGEFYEVRRTTEQFDDLVVFLRSDTFRNLDWERGTGSRERGRTIMLTCWNEHCNESDLW
jgi:hypothetical protein